MGEGETRWCWERVGWFELRRIAEWKQRPVVLCKRAGSAEPCTDRRLKKTKTGSQRYIVAIDDSPTSLKMDCMNNSHVIVFEYHFEHF